MATITRYDDIEGLVPRLQSDCENSVYGNYPFTDVPEKAFNPAIAIEILWQGKPHTAMIKRFTPLVILVNYFSREENVPASHIHFFVNGDLVDITQHSLVTLSYYLMHRPLHIEGKISYNKPKVPIVSLPKLNYFQTLVIVHVQIGNDKLIQIPMPMEANFELLYAVLSIRLERQIGTFFIWFRGKRTKYSATFRKIRSLGITNFATITFN